MTNCTTRKPDTRSDSVAVILLGRGALSASGNAEISVLAEHLRSTLAAAGTAPVLVQPAFVDRAQPALPEALDLCAEAGARHIIIVAVMVPDEAALRRWLHKLIMRWRARRADAHHIPRIVFGEPLLQMPQLAEALAQTVQGLLTQSDEKDVPNVVGNDPWEHDPVGWSSVPEHQHHVLWCVGPRCAAKGAVQLWPRLASTVREKPDLKKRVMLLQTSCQYPCNHGPMMIIYPEGTWYGPLDAAGIERTLTQHVLHGRVDEDLCFHGSLDPNHDK